MKYYLGGAIFGRNDEEAKDWRTEVKLRLTMRGHDWIDPMDHDFRGRELEAAHRIVDRDIKDILRCDALLVNAREPTWGTAMEIHFAYTLRLVIVVLPVDHSPSPWLIHHTDEIHYGSIVKVAETL